MHQRRLLQHQHQAFPHVWRKMWVDAEELPVPLSFSRLKVAAAKHRLPGMLGKVLAVPDLQPLFLLDAVVQLQQLLIQ